MKKKILSLLLSMAMIFSFSLAALADVKGSDDTSCSECDKTLTEAAGGSASVDTEATAEMMGLPEMDEETIAKYAFVIQGDPNLYNERQEMLRSVSEEILALPTDELLAYFLDSSCMEYEMCESLALSTPDDLRPARDFTVYPVFAELLTRDDILSVLSDFEASLEQEPETGEYFVFQSFLRLSGIEDILADSNKELSEAAGASTRVGEYVTTVNGVRYFFGSYDYDH